MDNVQVDWNVVRKSYGDGDPSLPMIGRERTSLFDWSANLDKVTQKYETLLANFNTSKYARTTKAQKIMDNIDTNHQVIRSWWLSSSATT